jgi:magnesium-transporting ATPase (P-type)
MESQNNPYAAPQDISVPQAFIRADEVFIAESCLLVPREYEFPPICFKSGETENLSKPIRKKLYWYHPAWIFLVLAGVLIFLIVVACVQKKGVVTFRLSQKEHKKQRTRVMTTVFFALFAILLFVLSAFADDYAAELIIGGFVSLFVLLILMVTISRLVTAKKIDDRHVWIHYKDPVVLQKVFAFCRQSAQGQDVVR